MRGWSVVMVGWGNDFRQPSADGLKSAEALWTIAVSLLLVWLVGIVSSSTFGGALHLLLPLALVAYVVSRIEQERADS
jgi:hypothetical protein